MTNNKIQSIHEKALLTAKKYKALEVELIDILQQVDQHRVYYKYGYSSLFKYAVNCLKLSEAVTYMFINVARKSKEVPELKAEIKSGSISVSKAKKIASVLTSENKDHWLNLAKSSTQAKIEKEVAKVSPREAIRNQMTYINPSLEISEKVKLKSESAVRVQLQVGISEKLMLQIRRAQDIVSQKKRATVSLEQVLEEAMKLYIERHDPVEKAKRHAMRNGFNSEASEIKSCSETPFAKSMAHPIKESDTNSAGRSLEKPLVNNTCNSFADSTIDTSKNNPTNSQFLRPVDTSTQKPTKKNKYRRPLPAKIKHQLFLKTNAQCTHVDGEGNRCSERRFLDIHHIKPLALGGSNHGDNLTLLCSGHHRVEHA